MKNHKESEVACPWLKEVFSCSPDAIAITDSNGTFMECNPACVALFECSSKDYLIGKSAFMLVAQTDRTKAVQDLQQTLKTGVVRDFRYTLLARDGREFPGELSVGMIKDLSGKTKGFVVTVKDISSRKKIEEELTLQAYLLNSVSDAIFLADLNGNLLYANETAYRSRGYSREEILKMKLFELDDPEHANLINSRIRDLLDKGEITFESVHICKDKCLMPVEVHARIVESGGKKLVLGVARDITERLMNQEALKESEEITGAIMTFAQDAIVLLDDKATVVFWNPAAEKIFGYRVEEAVGQDFCALAVPACAQEPMRSWLRKLSSGNARKPMNSSMESVVLRKDRTRFQAELSLSAVQLRGKWHGIAIIRDVTERKSREHKIRLLSTVAEQMSEAVAVSDREGRLVFANAAWAEMHGYTDEELVDKNISLFYQQPETECSFSRAALSRGLVRGRLVNVRKDGTVFTTLTTFSSLSDENSSIVGIVRLAKDIRGIVSEIRDVGLLPKNVPKEPEVKVGVLEREPAT